MTDNVQQQEAAVKAFNASVDNAIVRFFEFNNVLMSEGFSPSVVILSAVLAATDLCAALAVQDSQSKEATRGLVEDLETDMLERVAVAFDFYSQQQPAPVTDDAQVSA